MGGGRKSVAVSQCGEGELFKIRVPPDTNQQFFPPSLRSAWIHLDHMFLIISPWPMFGILVFPLSFFPSS